MTVETDISMQFRGLLTDIAKFSHSHEHFLTQHQQELLIDSKKIVKQVVYGVPFHPKYYKRTYNTLASMGFDITQESMNQSRAYIRFDPSVAPALIASGGYPQFIAGEGSAGRPKIGFLKTQYGRRKSHFPRKFHIALEKEMSDKLINLYEKDVLKHL